MNLIHLSIFATMKNLFFLAIAVLLSISVSSQTTVKVMSYNVLNFPTGDIPNREDTLKSIVNFVEPDLLLLQELKTEAGLNDIAAVSFEDFEDTYAASTFIPQVSNPNTSWPLQQGIVYNTRVFGLAEETVVTSTYRDFNRYKLFFNDIELSTGADTTFLYVYVTHLKSSQGEENEQLRLEMVEDFVEHLATVPSDIMVLLGGDFNVYTSDEPAYQLLLDANNPIQFLDPIDAPGNWHSSSYPFKQVLTQSTRANQIFNDGAGGGLDDRFDFVLASANLFDSASPIQYVQDSYEALGNNGDCYNGDILDCMPNDQVPDDIMTALYYMSDHLPVVFDLETPVTVGMSPRAVAQSFEFKATQQENTLGLYVQSHTNDQATVRIYSVTGQLIHTEQLNITTGNSRHSITLDWLNSGYYIVNVQMGTNSLSKKLVWR